MSDDPYVIRLLGGVNGLEQYPELFEQLDRYVVDYQPELAPKGEQWIWTSDKLEDAKQFADAGEVHVFLTQSIGSRPWDGQPDRPISVFHVEIAQRSAHE
jgi:hypothetical protein